MPWSVNKRLNHIVTKLKEHGCGPRICQRIRDYWVAYDMDALLAAWKQDATGKYSGTGLTPANVAALKPFVVALASLADANEAILTAIEAYDRGVPPENWDQE